MKKVAIIGYASNWNEAPFSDPDVEIWVQNIAEILKYPFGRITRVFDIHKNEIIVAECKDFPAGLKYVNENNIPCYLQEKSDLIPSSVEFPIDLLTEMFFPWATRIKKWKYNDEYWTSTTQMMIAFAIHEGFTEIGIYGIDMSDTVEYRGQRRGCEYMLGYAVGKGLSIKRSTTSGVLRTRFRYGYEETEENAYRRQLASRVEYMKQRIEQLNQEGMAKAAEKMHLEGALHAFTELEMNWLDA